jgi:hypothetical protein
MTVSVIVAVTVTVTVTVACNGGLCGACDEMLGKRGLALVVHFPSGCLAKINTP